MKSRYFEPNESLFQIVVMDYKHRKPVPNNVVQSGQIKKMYHDVLEYVPHITLFRRAKNAEQAKKSASKQGSVISCHKVDSHLRRLEMISHLNIEMKPILVDISAEEFIVGRDLEITPAKEIKKIDVNGT